MFELTARIYNGKDLVKYEVLDRDNNKTRELSVETVYGLAIANSLTNATYNNNKGTLTGTNGNDLRTLPRKQDKNKSLDTKRVLVGKELKAFIDDKTSDYPNERYLIKELMQFLASPSSHKVCALYGLRRTGKSVLIYHSIKRLLNNGITNIALFSLTSKDYLATIYKNLNNFINKGIKYVFLDEITAVNRFIQYCAILSDVYSNLGIKNMST